MSPLTEVGTALVIVYVTMAALIDLRTQRIPNALSATAALLGLIAQVSLNGAPGLLSALAGAAIGLGMFLPFYLLRAVGAGDVKAMATVGIFLGAQATPLAVAFPDSRLHRRRDRAAVAVDDCCCRTDPALRIRRSHCRRYVCDAHRSWGHAASLLRATITMSTVTHIQATSAQRSAPAIAPRPQSIAATGLSLAFFSELAEEHLFEGGVLTMRDLVMRMALSGPLLEEILAFLRKEGRIEVRTQIKDELGLRYGLTERGRGSALAAQMVSGYIGPAPVPLKQYVNVVESQSVRACTVRRERMHAAFADMVMDGSMLDRLGPALNSGKAIFVYGAPGTGRRTRRNGSRVCSTTPA